MLWSGGWCVIDFKLIICCLQRFREPGAGYRGEQSLRQERVKSMSTWHGCWWHRAVGDVCNAEVRARAGVKHTYPNAALNTLELLGVRQEPSFPAWYPQKSITSLHQQFAVCFYFALGRALGLFSFFFSSYTSLVKNAVAAAEQEELCLVLIHANMVALCSPLCFLDG